MSRHDGRTADQLRPTTIQKDAQKFAEASVMIDCGDTRVLCAVSVEEQVPPFLVGRGQGWLTAEYRMLPRATSTRTQRESRPRGRTQEIQRLIGRALRGAVDLQLLGERSLLVDCDVLQADGGTRTASITGGYVALSLALAKLQSEGLLESDPVVSPVAAVSVGVVGGVPVLDLPYVEDVAAEVDMNLVMNGQGEFIELQGTGEKNTFSDTELATMLAQGRKGIGELLDLQRSAIADG